MSYSYIYIICIYVHAYVYLMLFRGPELGSEKSGFGKSA